jgi:hypothetical protein
MVDQTPKVVQQPGHTTQKADQYVGAPRQITVDVSRQELRLHDGRKAGGWRFPNLRQLTQMFMSNNSEFGKVDFTQDARGFLARSSDKTWRVRQLLAKNGLSWLNPLGDSGDPTISLPDRLKESSPYSAAALNDIIETGFYMIAKAEASLPDAVHNNDDAVLIVVGYNDTVTPFSLITQLIMNASLPTGDIYSRRRVNNVWSPWITVSSVKGLIADLNDGVDQAAKAWSPFDIVTFIRQQIQTIQYIDASNVAKAFSINVLFSQAGAGADTQTVTGGAFNVATNDRFELVGSATAPAGTSRTAKVEMEIAGVFQTIATQAVNAPAGSALTDNVIGRVVKTAGGIDIVDANWATQSSIAGAASGNFRFTTGASEKAGCRLTRWR